MNDNDKEKLMYGVKEMYNLYNEQMTEFGAEIWLHAFENYPVDRVLEMLVKYVETPNVCRFMPKPGDIIAMLSPIPEYHDATDDVLWT